MYRYRKITKIMSSPFTLLDQCESKFDLFRQRAKSALTLLIPSFLFNFLDIVHYYCDKSICYKLLFIINSYSTVNLHKMTSVKAWKRLIQFHLMPNALTAVSYEKLLFDTQVKQS